MVDSFVGLLPEAAIRSWIEGLLPTPAEEKAAAARRSESDDPAAAERLYREANALDPQSATALIGLGRVLLAQDRLDELNGLIAKLEARGFLEPEAERLKAERNLRAGARDAGDLATRRAEAAAHPGDPDARFRLAEALAAAGEYAEALELALALVEEGPRHLVESARTLMVSIFQLLPEDSELVSEYRRRLSAALH